MIASFKVYRIIGNEKEIANALIRIFYTSEVIVTVFICVCIGKFILYCSRINTN